MTVRHCTVISQTLCASLVTTGTGANSGPFIDVAMWSNGNVTETPFQNFAFPVFPSVNFTPRMSLGNLS
jgi:hypothetical protein